MNLPEDQSKSRLLSIYENTVEIIDSSGGKPVDWVLDPGAVVDSRYRIVKPLGRGGMGAVYVAHQLNLDKQVALKTFHCEHVAEGASERFRREAQAIAKIHHPNVVQIFDFGIAELGVPYYTMEYLRGESLAERIKKTPVDLRTSFNLIDQICAGLAASHAKGIVHRDLKPGNLFLESGSSGGPTVKLVDFGIAAIAQAGAEEQRLTQRGCVIGSPLYLSPEQARGKEANVRSDIYSLACVIWELLVGAPPFRGKTSIDTVFMHASAKRPLLTQVARHTSYPQELEQLLRVMMDVEPDNRPASALEVSNQLQCIKSEMIAQSKLSGKAGAQGQMGNNLDRNADIREKNADIREQKADIREKNADIREQKADIREKKADIREQNADIQDQNSGEKLGISPFRTMQIAMAVLVLLAFVFIPLFVSSHSQKGDVKAELPSKKTVSSPEPETTRLDFRGHTKFVISKSDSGILQAVLSSPDAFPVGRFKGDFEDASHPDSDKIERWQLRYPPVFIPTTEFESIPDNFDVFGKCDCLGGIVFRDVHDRKQMHDLITKILTFPKITNLEFDSCQLSASEIWRLNDLKQLRVLNLHACGISLQGLSAFRRYKTLDGIGFGGADASQVSTLLAQLNGSESLKYLFLKDDNALTQADFRVILSLKNLVQLQLTGTNTSNADVKNLRALKHLQVLNVTDTKITGDVLPTIKEMAKGDLREFYADQDNWSRAQFDELRRIHNLTLSSTPLIGGGTAQIDKQAIDLFNSK